MQIIGLFMVKNEDVYIEQAIRNVVDFCDKIYVDDNGSSDQTIPIVERLQKEFSHIHLRSIEDTLESNENLIQYFGTDTWIFAVDGDEIYDKPRLVEMRERLEKGEFDDWWLIHGNCLHVTKIAEDRSKATGFMSPPSRSMTKLYNFSMITDFPITDERLHGIPVFKNSQEDIKKRLELFNQYSWEESFFRCVHTAFVTRTSNPETQTSLFGVRLNPPQIHVLKKLWYKSSIFYSVPRIAKLLLEVLFRKDVRIARYRQGTKTTKDVSEFFV